MHSTSNKSLFCISKDFEFISANSKLYGSNNKIIGSSLLEILNNFDFIKQTLADCSSFNDFQARRSNIKYKDEDGTTKYCFSLNNTAIASPRILIPLLELNQNADGSVNIPEVLVPYMGGMTKIMPKNK